MERVGFIVERLTLQIIKRIFLRIDIQIIPTSCFDLADPHYLGTRHCWQAHYRSTALDAAAEHYDAPGSCHDAHP
jgi:hypothetical protein